VAGIGAVLLGIALLRTHPTPRARPRAGALLLIAALPVGLAGVILVSGLGFVNIAGLPLTVLYGGAWIVLWQSPPDAMGRERNGRAALARDLNFGEPAQAT
jgi:hypothetical protein